MPYGNTEQDTLKQLVTSVGEPVYYGDTQVDLWRRLVTWAEFAPAYGTTVQELMGEWIEAWGGVDPGGTEINRLRAIVELHGGHPAAGDSSGDLLNKLSVALIPPVPTGLIFPFNGSNLNVVGDWDMPPESVTSTQFRYDNEGDWEDVVPVAPDFAVNQLRVVGPAGLHTVNIRFGTDSGFYGPSAESDQISLVG